MQPVVGLDVKGFQGFRLKVEETEDYGLVLERRGWFCVEDVLARRGLLLRKEKGPRRFK